MSPPLPGAKLRHCPHHCPLPVPSPVGAAEGELVEPVRPVPAERGDSSGGGGDPWRAVPVVTQGGRHTPERWGPFPGDPWRGGAGKKPLRDGSVLCGVGGKKLLEGGDPHGTGLEEQPAKIPLRIPSKSWLDLLKRSSS